LRFYGAFKKIIAPKICHNCRKYDLKPPKNANKRLWQIIEIIGEALG
jgi:hypothetical protein